MTAIALCLLAVSDAAFSGFRAHAGRDGRIVKRRSKLLASLTGVVAGVITLVGLGAVLLASIGLGASTYDELSVAGSRMLAVYAIYATLIAIGFVAYFCPWLEVRSLATMLVLGPGTFVRPVVILAGAAAAAVGSAWFPAIAAAVAASALLAIEPVLRRWFDRRQESTMAPFVAAPSRLGARSRRRTER